MLANSKIGGGGILNKLNNNGFVSSALLYSLLLIFLALIISLLSLLHNRKMILDRLKSDIKGNITKINVFDFYENGTIVYYNPVTNKICNNYTEDNSKTGVTEGCLKWYIFNDNANNASVNMILDHNTSGNVAWSTDTNNPTVMKEVIERLEEDTSTWKQTTRLITADEVAEITGANLDTTIKWNSSKTYGTGDTETYYSWFYLSGSGTTYSNTDGWQKQVSNATTKSKYAWLFDNTYNCIDYGCNVEDNNEYPYGTKDSTNTAVIEGYWTSTPINGFGLRSWCVGRIDDLSFHGSINTEYYFGVRPVITISKKQISDYIIPTLVNNENKTSISDGTEKDPYYVSTIEDLVILSNNVNKGNSYENKIIILINDIDFKNKENYLDYTSKEYGDINGDGITETIYEELTTSSGFIPIGNGDNSFSGIFNGNNKIIDNLLINREMPYQALFGNNLGTIKNITVTGNVYGIYRVSGIASYNQGALINCINRVNLKMTLVANYENEDRNYFGGNIGGIAGQNKGTISNSINEGNITSTYKTGTSDNGYIGGITGHNTGKISNSYNEGTIIGISTRDTVTGGITGANYGSAVVTDCYNKGSITSSTTLSTAASFSGGIVGLNRATVLNTYNIGTLKSTGSGNKCAIYNDTNGTVTNSYYLDTCSLGGAGTSKTSTELKAISGTLGSEFKNDTNLINNGYPILKWQ